MHEFDKSYGFAIVTNDTAKEKIEEQLGKATKAKVDPTSRLTNKIQKKLCKLIKENRFYKQDLLQDLKLQDCKIQDLQHYFQKRKSKYRNN